MDFDLTDVGLFAAGFPHPTFARLRREAPVYWHAPTAHTPDGEGFWVLSRHADVLAVLHDPVTFSSEGGGGRASGGTFLEDTPYGGVMLNMMDPPRHDRLRGLVNKGFTARGIGALEGDLRARTDAILAPVLRRGRCEFVREVARELPLQAICGILGVRAEDRDRLCDDVSCALERPAPGAVADPGARAAALERIRAYGRALIADRRARPRGDVLSVVVQAELPGANPPRLTDPELELFFLLLFVAGSETTRRAIAGGVKALSEHPAEWARLRSSPELVPTAIEETVRWTSPAAYTRRTLTRDFELHGEKLRPGEKVTVWAASANRDEDVFHEPDRFDVGRRPNPHLGFAHGLHYCLGANLARLELRVVLEALLARVDAFELDGPVHWTRDNRLFGVREMPLRLRTAAA